MSIDTLKRLLLKNCPISKNKDRTHTCYFTNFLKIFSMLHCKTNTFLFSLWMTGSKEERSFTTLPSPSLTPSTKLKCIIDNIVCV